METKKLIEQKLVELQQSKTKYENNNNDLDFINKCIEILNNLDENMLNLDVDNLIRILNRNGYSEDNIKSTFNNINTLIEFYIIRKKVKVELPEVYKNKLEEIKNNLIIIKGNIEKSKITIGDIDKDIADLKEIIQIVNEKSNEKISEELFKTLYYQIIVNLNPSQRLELYKLIMNIGKENIKNEEKIEDEKSTDIDKIIELFKCAVAYVGIESYCRKHEKELLDVTDINRAREIIEFLKSREIVDNFFISTLVNIVCYGDIDIVKKVYNEIMIILNDEEEYNKNNEKNAITFGDFCDSDSLALWLNEPKLILEPLKIGKKVDDGRKYPSCLKNRSANIRNLKYNVDVVKNNTPKRFSKTSDKSLYLSSVMRFTSPYIISKNVKLATIFDLRKLNMSSVKNDIETRINYAIELGLLKTPRLNSFLYAKQVREMLKDKEQKIKDQFKGLNYFENEPSKLITIPINEMAYYASFFSKTPTSSVIDIYNDFFNSDHTLSEHRTSSNYRADVSYMDTAMNQEQLNQKISDYSKYSSDIDEYKQSIKIFPNYYFNPEIVFDDIVGEFERDFCLKDAETMEEADKTYKRDEYVYKIGNRYYSRYRILHNLTILKNKYGYISKDILLTSIVKDSIIFEKELDNILSSNLINELSFYETRMQK